MAETEREFIRQRQAEGIALVRKKGVKLGRNGVDTPRDFSKYYKLWKSGNITIRVATEDLGMSETTFYRRCKERDKKM